MHSAFDIDRNHDPVLLIFIPLDKNKMFEMKQNSFLWTGIHRSPVHTLRTNKLSHNHFDFQPHYESQYKENKERKKTF